MLVVDLGLVVDILLLVEEVLEVLVAEQMELLLEVVLVEQEKLFQLQCLVLLPLLMVLLDLLLEDGFLEVEEVLLITIQVLHPKMELVDHSLVVGDLMLGQEMEG